MTLCIRFGRAAAVAVPAIALVMVVPLAAVPASAAPAPVAATVACGDTVTTSTVLINDVGPCSVNDAITLSGSNITLDLNGHTVFGNEDPAVAQVGIHAFKSPGDTIENGQVYGFATGVYLEKSTNDTVTRMTLHDNIGPLDGSGLFGEGLQIFEGGGHVVSHDLVVHNGPFAGIDSFSSSNNTFKADQVVSNNIVEMNAQHLGPTIMQDIGVWVLNLSSADPAGATDNTVADNHVVGNGLDGIQVGRFTDGNRVQDNVVRANGFGQVMGIRDGDGIADFGNSNTVQGNTSDSNAANGIRVVFSASGGVPVGGQHNTVVVNQASGNGTGRNSVGVAFDLSDTNLSPPCDANIWLLNLYRTISQSCVAFHVG
ncbi:MAG: right-handed parallel beta-helix repeat-containing protein [Acidimicrobiales bacterium]